MSAIKNSEINFAKLFVNNEFVDSLDGKTFDTINLATSQKLAVQEVGARVVDLAIQAAPSSSASLTGKWMLLRGPPCCLGSRISWNATKFTWPVSSEQTTANRSSLLWRMPTAIGLARSYAGAADKVSGSVLPSNGKVFAYTRYELVGVIAAILRGNYPIEITCGRITPTIAMGNTVVIKPF